MSPINEKLRQMNPKKREEAIWCRVFGCSKYPQWVDNIVLCPKMMARLKMCVDYQNLNQANPKDNFPLSYLEILVDNTARFSLFSFMDGFSGYNQIKMAWEDMEKTTFITLWGTFCYKVMQFGLNLSKSDGDSFSWYDA